MRNFTKKHSVHFNGIHRITATYYVAALCFIVFVLQSCSYSKFAHNKVYYDSQFSIDNSQLQSSGSDYTPPGENPSEESSSTTSSTAGINWFLVTDYYVQGFFMGRDRIPTPPPEPGADPQKEQDRKEKEIEHRNILGYNQDKTSFYHYASLRQSNAPQRELKTPASPPDGLYLRSGIGFIQKGGVEKFGNGKSKIRLNYVQIPVIGLYKYTLPTGRIYGGIGPYFAYGVGGKVKTTSGGTSTTEKSFSKDYFRRFDAGLNILAGYEFNSGFKMHLGYERGMANIGRDGDIKTRNRTLNLNFGYSLSKILSGVKQKKSLEKKSQARTTNLRSTI